ncbi:MAG TPA: response regulator, partial [Polyangiaceae bacterium]
MPKFGVLIVDDSALLRQVLRATIDATSDLFVIAEAKDGLEATALVKSTYPDVMTLDVQMPRLDGLTFLHGLMRLKPMPVVMCSSLTAAGCHETIEALELGAVDFVTKPSGSTMSLDAFADEVVAKLRRALQLTARVRSDALRKPTPLGIKAVNAGVTFVNGPQETRAIAIGANTGGIVSLITLLSALPGRCPPIVISQYLPTGVAEVIVARLQKRCSVEVKIVEDGEPLRRDVVFLAPSERHVSIVLAGGKVPSIHCDDGPPIDKARPSSTKL